MKDFSKYQFAQYCDGGRGRGRYDCWGLVREVLHDYYSVPLLASYGDISPADKGAFTRASCRMIKRSFETSEEISEGQVIAGYIGQRMQHVGVIVKIDGLLKVLHAHQRGVRFDRVADFKKISGSSFCLFEYKNND